jgi:hypothetical protein
MKIIELSPGREHVRLSWGGFDVFEAAPFSSSSLLEEVLSASGKDLTELSIFTVCLHSRIEDTAGKCPRRIKIPYNVSTFSVPNLYATIVTTPKPSH